MKRTHAPFRILGRRFFVDFFLILHYCRYPFTEEAVDKLLEDGVNRLVVLPLYPQVRWQIHSNVEFHLLTICDEAFPWQRASLPPCDKDQICDPLHEAKTWALML
jgi:hypothetical protein